MGNGERPLRERSGEVLGRVGECREAERTGMLLLLLLLLVVDSARRDGRGEIGVLRAGRTGECREVRPEPGDLARV